MKKLSLILAILLNMLPGILQAQGNPVIDKCIPCEKLTELKINEAVTVSSGSLYCKILGVIGREIKFELLLPDKWNNIFIMGGGGEGPSSVDWIVLIRDWVENGKPPERVIVSKVVNGKEVMTRPIFPYPDEAVYSGSGDPLKESNFIIKD
jgi:hypothetical protein